MKKAFCIISLLISSVAYGQPSGWVTSTDSLFGFSFAMPTNPSFSDTLNISHYFSSVDSIGLQVLVFRAANLDSTNTNFINYLQLAGGDTLMALTNELLVNTNSTLTGSQELSYTNGYSGLEANLRYNTTVNGKNVVNFIRMYYKNSLLLTFSITGYEPDISNVTSKRDSFFNSIML